MKLGRTEIVVSGTTTYIYYNENINAENTDEDWYATRIVTAGDNKSIKARKGCFNNYSTEW